MEFELSGLDGLRCSERGEEREQRASGGQDERRAVGSERATRNEWTRWQTYRIEEVTKLREAFQKG